MFFAFIRCLLFSDSNVPVRVCVILLQEMSKDVPSLPSSQYGKRLANFYDAPDRQYVRIGYIETDFYRRNGTNLSDDGVKVLPH